jgi:hypothetical protein
LALCPSQVNTQVLPPLAILPVHHSPIQRILSLLQSSPTRLYRIAVFALLVTISSPVRLCI